MKRKKKHLCGTTTTDFNNNNNKKTSTRLYVYIVRWILTLSVFGFGTSIVVYTYWFDPRGGIHYDLVHHQHQYSNNNNTQNHNVLRRRQKQQQENAENTDHGNQMIVNNEMSPNTDLKYRIHAFYYPWYGNPQFDGQYYHWNHPVLPHWDARISAQYPEIGTRHDPDVRDLGSSYYPSLGPYSSADVEHVIRRHMVWIQRAQIGVVVASWLPKSEHDDNGPPIAQRLGSILDIAQEYDIRVAIHMEPYENRTLSSIYKDIQELLEEHGNAPALYKLPRRPTTSSTSNPNPIEQLLPVLYFYDQYRLSVQDVWSQLLSDPSPKHPKQHGMIRGVLAGLNGVASSSSSRGRYSIRGTKYDVVAIALIVEASHWDEYVGSGGNGEADTSGGVFDGGYTYFASDTFTYGSHPRNWKILAEKARQSHKYFIPSVGPGYDDTRIRPWNSVNTKSRDHFLYFDREWKTAIQSQAQYISVTSFNEWHEGTQIEPAIPMTATSSTTSNKLREKGTHNNKPHKYLDYEEAGGPDAYLIRNKFWVDRFLSSLENNQQQQQRQQKQ